MTFCEIETGIYMALKTYHTCIIEILAFIREQLVPVKQLLDIIKLVEAASKHNTSGSVWLISLFSSSE